MKRPLAHFEPRRSSQFEHFAIFQVLRRGSQPLVRVVVGTGTRAGVGARVVWRHRVASVADLSRMPQREHRHGVCLVYSMLTVSTTMRAVQRPWRLSRTSGE